MNAAVAPVLAARLDSLIFTEEATVADWTGTHVSHGVHGPQALDVAGAALDRLGAGREGGVPASAGWVRTVASWLPRTA